MTNRIGIIAVLCVLAVVAGLLFFGRHHSLTIPLPEAANKTDVLVSSSALTGANHSAGALPTNAQQPSATQPANFSPVTATPRVLPTEPEFTNLPPAAVLENMRMVFRNYISMFGSNPVGTNPEITQALDGGNPKQTHFLNADDGLRINGRGELIDPWGTPYFFHQLSGTEMEIHSAGPDRVMWTADDMVIK